MVKNWILMMAVKIIFKALASQTDKLIEFKNALIEKIKVHVAESETQVDDFFLGMMTGTGEEAQQFGDMILDLIEEYVLGTASTIDDALVLPAVNMLREIANIPDFPDV